jgi:Xaa-Pro aminopeptidase
LLEKCNTIYLDFEPKEINDLITPTEKLAQDIKTKRPWVNVNNARPLFANASMIKHEEEIEEMKKAIHITRLGIENILVNIKES